MASSMGVARTIIHVNLNAKLITSVKHGNILIPRGPRADDELNAKVESISEAAMR